MPYFQSYTKNELLVITFNDDGSIKRLNDSKYGYRVKDNVLELTLLRCVRYPGPFVVKEDSRSGISGYTDLGEHNFIYSLYPHQGDYVEGCVVQEGYELNLRRLLLKRLKSLKEAVK